MSLLPELVSTEMRPTPLTHCFYHTFQEDRRSSDNLAGSESAIQRVAPSQGRENFAQVMPTPSGALDAKNAGHAILHMLLSKASLLSQL